MRGCASWIVGFAAFFGLSELTGELLGPTTCRDGWHSPSIGHRGACSWHGGVDHSRDILIFLYLAGGAFAGFTFHESKIGRSLDKEPPRPAAPERPTIPPPATPVHRAPPRRKPVVPPRDGQRACPTCGSVMRL